MKIRTAVEVSEVPAEFRRVLWRARGMIVFTDGFAPVFFDIEQVEKALAANHADGYGDLDRGEKNTLEETKTWMIQNKIETLLFAPV